MESTQGSKTFYTGHVVRANNSEKEFNKILYNINKHQIDLKFAPAPSMFYCELYSWHRCCQGANDLKREEKDQKRPQGRKKFYWVLKINAKVIYFYYYLCKTESYELNIPRPLHKGLHIRKYWRSVFVDRLWYAFVRTCFFLSKIEYI